MINFYVLQSTPRVSPGIAGEGRVEHPSSSQKSLWSRVGRIRAAILAAFGIRKKSEKREVNIAASVKWQRGLIGNDKWLVDQLDQRQQYGKELLESAQLIENKKGQRDKFPKGSLERNQLEEEIEALDQKTEQLNGNIILVDEKIYERYGRTNYRNMKDWATSKSYVELERSASFKTNEKGEEFAGFTISPSILNETQWIRDKIAGVTPPFAKDEKGNIKEQEYTVFSKPRMGSTDIPLPA